MCVNLFSFDGRWLTYNSSESGTEQVYAISFPAADQKLQISKNGGAEGLWRQDGRELYYLSLDGKFMAVDISTSGGKLHAVPHLLFDAQFVVSTGVEQYAVTGDGTPLHQHSIREMGRCSIHRRSFDYIRELCSQYSDLYYEMKAIGRKLLEMENKKSHLIKNRLCRRTG